eukprot:1065396-Pelagomonas_calceolata.AAC.7
MLGPIQGPASGYLGKHICRGSLPCINSRPRRWEWGRGSPSSSALLSKERAQRVSAQQFDVVG